MVNHWYRVFFGLGLLRLVCLFPSHKLLPRENELGHVVVQHVTNHRLSRRSSSRDGMSPSEIYTILSAATNTTSQHDVTLRFVPQRNQRMSPVYLNGRRLLIGQNLTQECSVFYEDPDQFAHAVVDRCSSPGHILMLAEVVYNGSIHLVVPTEPAADGQIRHKLYSLDTPVDYQRDFAVPERPNILPSPRPQRQKRADGQNVVEIVFIIDYSIYKYWYDMTTGTDAEREATAVSNILTFFAFFSKATSLRYGTMKASTSNSVDVKVELVSIYILKTAAASSITDAVTSEQNPRGQLDAVQLLQTFTTWVADQLANNENFPAADHHMLLTYRDLYIDTNLRAAGYANLGTICDTEATSVVEWSFQALSATTAAHELAHGFGGQHDGTGNSCDGQDLYILAAANVPGTGDKVRNPWIFSECSAQYIRTKVDSLESSGNNCLLTIDNAQRLSVTGKPMGQLYSPDQQCQQAFGSTSELARAAHEGVWGDLCTGLWCTTTSITSVTIQLPLLGTSCGNNKWCENGLCVSSQEAPEVDPACMFGDQPTEFEDGRTCELVAKRLSYCYNSRVLTACCTSCLTQKLDIANCEYGDRSDCSAISSSQCYDDNTRYYCCQKCLSFEDATLPLTCKYGDRMTGCRTQFCESNPDDCCGTCAGLTTPQTSAPQATMTTNQVSVSTKAFTATTKATIETTKAPTAQTSKASTGGTTQSPTVRPTATPTGSTGLADWVIPVAAAAGGLIGLGAIIAVIYVCCCKRKSPQPNHSRHNSSEHRRESHHSDRSNNRRRNSPSRHHDNHSHNNHHGHHGHHGGPRRHSQPHGYSRY